jgi:hypothetical protein
VIGSHWNTDEYGWLRTPYEQLSPEKLVVAVDERTVAIGDGASWAVAGQGAVHVTQHGRDEVYGDGDRFEARLT